MPAPTRAWLSAALFLTLVTVVPVSASTSEASPRLAGLLALQRLVCPQAIVSGRFADWRNPSRYRSHAGLHYGYDIAMPAGTSAVVGWPGQVTRVLQWSGPEYGITVVSPSGFETTYGHLHPRVKVGDVLNAGDVVGIVVNDHVDVKMRAPNGAYFDFGGDGAPGPAVQVALPSLSPQAWREEGLVIARLARIEKEAGRMLETARQRQDEAAARLEALQRVAVRGAASPAEVEEARRALESVRSQCAELAGCVRDARDKRLAREVRWRQAAPSTGKVAAAPEPALVGLAAGPARDLKRLSQYELLFRRGAISRDELDAERRRQGLGSPVSASR